MNGEKAILTVDAGTGDCRVIAFSLRGRVLSSSHVEWSYTAGADGMIAFEPDACFGGVSRLLKQVVGKLHGYEIVAITVTSQRDGMAFLDAAGREVYCAPNMDLRGDVVLSELAPHRAEILRATGLPLHGMFGLPRLVWHKEFAPATYEKIDCVMMLCDWLAYRLCGEKRSERAAASSSQMLSITSGEYDTALMARLGLRQDIFPRACAATECIGTLRAAVGMDIGLAAGVPVFIGGSDAHCGAAGMGLFTAGQTAVIAGTTTPILALGDHPMIDDNGALYSSFHSVPDVWALEGNADSTGLSLRWVREMFFGSKRSAYARLDAEAASAPAGCGGLSAYIGVGVRGVPKGRNYGGFVFPVPWNIEDYSRAHLLRAALESNAYGVRANLEVLWQSGAEKPQVLSVCGGQSRSRVFCQMLADITGLPVKTGKNPEATALGAAMMAACGAGEFSSLSQAVGAFCHKGTEFIPRPETSKKYDGYYHDWRKLHGYLLDYHE